MSTNEGPKPKIDEKQENVSTTVKTNTLAIVGLVIAFIVPLIGMILSIVALNQIKKSKENGKGAAIAGIVVSIIVMIFQFVLVLAISLKGPVIIEYSDEEKANQSTTSQPKQQTTEVPAEKELSYEIVSENKKGNTNRVIVYTTESTNEQLIKLNDELLQKYKSGVSILYIDYFNDKTVASTYFDKQFDPSVSDAEKDQLYKSYIANMIYNTNTGTKELVRQGDAQTVIKNY